MDIGEVGTDAIWRADADGLTIGLIIIPPRIQSEVTIGHPFKIAEFSYLGQYQVSNPVWMVRKDLDLSE